MCVCVCVLLCVWYVCAQAKALELYLAVDRTGHSLEVHIHTRCTPHGTHDTPQDTMNMGVFGSYVLTHAVLRLWNFDACARAQYDMHPSLPIGPGENTPLHYAASGAMGDLLKMFMSHGGSPNTPNEWNQNALHAVCGCMAIPVAAKSDQDAPQGSEGRPSATASSSRRGSGMLGSVMFAISPNKVRSGEGSRSMKASSLDRETVGGETDPGATMRARMACLRGLVEWRGLEIDGMSESVSMNAVDTHGNTSLHYAAANGFAECCDELVNNGCILTLVNKDHETPCDLAAKYMHHRLADALEGRMVFNIVSASEINTPRPGEDEAEPANPHMTVSLDDAEVVAFSDRSVEKARAETFKVIEPWLVLTLLPSTSRNLATATGGAQAKQGEQEAQKDPEGALRFQRALIGHLLNACEYDGSALLVRAHQDIHELFASAKLPKEWLLESPRPSTEEIERAEAEAAEAARVHALANPYAWVVPGASVTITMAEDHDLIMKGEIVQVKHKARFTTGAAEDGARAMGEEFANSVLCEVFVHELGEEVDNVAVSSLSPCEDDEAEKDAEAAMVAAESLPSAKVAGREGEQDEATSVCSVCAEQAELLPNDGCGHALCLECWKGHATVRLREGSGSQVVCANYGCNMKMCDTVMEAALRGGSTADTETGGAEDMVHLRSLWKNSVRAEVIRRAKSLKQCTNERCSRVVQWRGAFGADECEPPSMNMMDAKCACGAAFCWKCFKEPHAPCTCDVWERWTSEVREHMASAQQVVGDAGGTAGDQDIGNRLWIAANTKRCPKCNTLIEKDEGCNHMSCSYCKHEFCWICMEDWFLHSNNTGGYYRCNRFDGVGTEKVVSTRNQGKGSAAEEARLTAERAAKVARFIHHYTRFSAHGQSADMENEKRTQTLGRMRGLQSQIVDEINYATSGQRRKRSDTPTSGEAPGRSSSSSSGGGGGVVDGVFLQSLQTRIDGGAVRHIMGTDAAQLLETAFDELYACRLMLRNSYVYAYSNFVEKKRRGRRLHLRSLEYNQLEQRRRAFEIQQSELEICTETLSSIAARRYIRASVNEIRSAIVVAQQKRAEFRHAIQHDIETYETAAGGAADSSGQRTGDGNGDDDAGDDDDGSMRDELTLRLAQLFGLSDETMAQLLTARALWNFNQLEGRDLNEDPDRHAMLMAPPPSLARTRFAVTGSDDENGDTVDDNSRGTADLAQAMSNLRTDTVRRRRARDRRRRRSAPESGFAPTTAAGQGDDTANAVPSLMPYRRSLDLAGGMEDDEALRSMNLGPTRSSGGGEDEGTVRFGRHVFSVTDGDVGQLAPSARRQVSKAPVRVPLLVHRRGVASHGLRPLLSCPCVWWHTTGRAATFGWWFAVERRATSRTQCPHHRRTHAGV